MKILVTGGTGFIGAHLTKSLISRGHEVTCLVRNEERARFLGDLGASLIQGDITDKDSLKKAVKGNGAVYHLAAIRGERNLPRRVYWNVNVEGTRKLMESALKAGAERFVYCSTSGVLGWPKKLPADESTRPNPKGLYHTTKYEGEKLVKDYQKRGLPATVVRPGITYGPGDRTGMVCKLSRLIKNGKFFIIGSGENFLHLTYVENLVQGFLSVLEKDTAVGQTYMVTDKKPITQKDLVGVIAGTLGKSPPGVRIPVSLASIAGFVFENLGFFSIEPLITRNRVEVMSKNRFYDISKIEMELGYKPKMNTEEGVEKTVRWFVENGYL